VLLEIVVVVFGGVEKLLSSATVEDSVMATFYSLRILLVRVVCVVCDANSVSCV
jgi:hypothetical protein